MFGEQQISTLADPDAIRAALMLRYNDRSMVGPLWWAECLGVGLVVGRRLIEGGAVPCLSSVVTDFPEISRKFEGLRLELVSRNFALVQQKSGAGPS